MGSRPRRRSLSTRRDDPPAIEQQGCPDCARPLAEHSIRWAPGEGYVLHNDALNLTCWKSLGHVTSEMCDALIRPGVLPPTARRPREEK